MIRIFTCCRHKISEFNPFPTNRLFILERCSSVLHAVRMQQVKMHVVGPYCRPGDFHGASSAYLIS